MKHSETPRKKRTQRDYNLGFKLAVISQVKGREDLQQSQKSYGIQGRSTVLVWLRKHGTIDWSKPRPMIATNKMKETPAQKLKKRSN